MAKPKTKNHSTQLTFKQKVKVFLASRLGIWILRFIHATLKWEKIGFDNGREQWADSTPIIGAFWHGRQLMIPWCYLEHKSKKCSRKMFVLISHHADGRIISDILTGLRIGTVFGSSSYGGANAMLALHDKIKAGHHVCFTPDGPRGPQYKAKQGVLLLAMLTGCPIFPVTYSAKNYWQLKSWDGMIIPKPFSPAVYILGTPLTFPKELDDTGKLAALKEIEDALNNITNQADHWFDNK